jgi:diacylglycerol kinase
MHPVTGKQSVLSSMRSALKGLLHALKGRNFLLLLCSVLVAIGLLVYFRIDTIPSLIVIALCVSTLISEIFNTAIEELSDALIKEHHPGIAKTKELSAGAVLLLALTTFFVTLYIIY